MEISSVPTEADYAFERDQAIKDKAFNSLSGHFLDKDKERFKADFLVDYVRRQSGSENVADIVRAIGKLMHQGRFRFPHHAPIDAAYALVRDGDV